MMNSRIILTDSGGIQEEGPSLNKPVLVLREETERKEGCESGALKLVGVKKDEIIKETIKIYFNEDLYLTMANSKNPFGNGKSAKKILNHLYSLK